jgi:hypothetical protein
VTEASPGSLKRLGLIPGLLMALVFVVAPGIAMGLDDMGAVPAWIWIGEIGWLGTFFVYPIWALWLGRVARPSRRRRVTPDRHRFYGPPDPKRILGVSMCRRSTRCPRRTGTPAERDMPSVTSQMTSIDAGGPA